MQLCVQYHTTMYGMRTANFSRRTVRRTLARCTTRILYLYAIRTHCTERTEANPTVCARSDDGLQEGSFTGFLNWGNAALVPAVNQKVGAGASGSAVKSYASATQKSGKAVTSQPVTKALNGAAVPFIPSGLASAMSAPQPPSGPTPNGIVPPGASSAANLAPSYRNAAAGAQRPPPPASIPMVMRPGGSSAAPLPSASLRVAAPTSNGPSSHSGSQQGHQGSLESSADVAASVPPGSAPLPSMLAMNAGQENGYRQAVFGGPPAGVAFQTPLQAKVHCSPNSPCPL